MNVMLPPGGRCGAVSVPSSKSLLHRLLLAAALSPEPCEIRYRGLSGDIRATIRCLRALGSEIAVGETRLRVSHLSGDEDKPCRLPCGDSGTTLRFLVPLAGALGRRAAFSLSEGLTRRPMEALLSALTPHGVSYETEPGLLCTRGRLRPGAYTIPGNISSQYISGLLLSLPLLEGDSTLEITGNIESAPYIRMTEQVLLQAGIGLEPENERRYAIPGRQHYALRGEIPAEGDWSAAAFFLCMGALSEKGITVRGLSLESRQGDRAILDLLRRFGAEVFLAGDSVTVKKHQLRGQTVDAAAIPDLIPAVSALAACAEGVTRIVNGGRLRWKESDRLESTCALLLSLGGDAEVTADGLVIRGKPALSGGTVSPFGDHRIAMAAAVAACACREPVCVTGAECAAKSYPDFWNDLERLEGLG